MTAAPRKTDPRLGTKVAGRYELDKLIGKGGMGVVYRGTHVATHRAVAVKLLHRDADDLAMRRFLREARIAAKVSHPNLVDVIDVGSTEDGEMFLVLELLEGEALSDHLKRKGAMRAEDALDTLVPIIDALAALHAAGVVHRDIKPSNIFLSLDGTSRVVPKLLDLGVSKQLDPGEALTESGAMLGTPHYMAPEQATGRGEVGVAADIWAMGVVLFETMSGDRPFTADTIPGLLYKIATDRPPLLGDRIPKLPPAVAAAVDRALAYESASRHASATELADALVEGAISAGWMLTCRMPSGPRISLSPFAPAVAPGDEMTPLLGGAGGTPPDSARDRTRDVPATSVSLPSSRSGSVVVRSDDDVVATDPTIDRGARAAVTPSAPAAAPDTTPSQHPRQLSTSPLKYALPVVGLLAAAGLGAWITSVIARGSETTPAPEPEPAAATPAVAVPDAGPAVAIAPAAEASESEVAPPPPVESAVVPRARARRAPVEAPAEPARAPDVQPPPRRDPPPPEMGTNGAPIID